MKFFTFIKNRIKSTFSDIFKEITIPEYISWWVIRIMFIYAAIMHTDDRQRVLCLINMLALYAIPFFRFIFPKNSLFGNLSYRAQHIINIMEFFGSYLGNYIDMHTKVAKYDRILHYLSGIAAVYAGYLIYKAILKKEHKEDSHSALLGSTYGMCFSFMIIPLWEITEFFGDFFYGTANQGYWYAPADDDIFYRVFGHGTITDGGQLPLWDTMMDMIDATVTTIGSAIVLYIVLVLIDKHKKKKAALPEKKNEKEKVTV